MSLHLNALALPILKPLPSLMWDFVDPLACKPQSKDHEHVWLSYVAPTL